MRGEMALAPLYIDPKWTFKATATRLEAGRQVGRPEGGGRRCHRRARGRRVRPFHFRSMRAMVTRMTKSKPIPLHDPSDREAEEITAAKTRRIARRPRLAASIEQADGTIHLGSPHADQAGWAYRATDAFGTPSRDFTIVEIGRIASALNARGEHAQDAVNAALAAVDGARCRDELEAMLVSQMACIHALAMDMIGRARRAESIEYLEACSKAANRASRCYAVQVEALTTLRRGGRHVVEVRHVHVYRPRRKPEGTPAKKQPLPRGPNGRFTAAPIRCESLTA
jgi:hypothetical protein